VLLLTTALSLLLLRDLFGVVMLAGLFSLISASLFMVLDAVDVAFTEAAVGAGISTVLYLGTLTLVGKAEKISSRPQILPALVAASCAGLLIYATADMPDFGDAAAPINQHVAPRYIHDSPEEVGPPNIVTSVLASYRGYDTLGETGVVFTAAVGVMLLLGSGRVRRRKLTTNEGQSSADKPAEEPRDGN
jgi:multicomponent Na+:H+ antiporter subunit B